MQEFKPAPEPSWGHYLLLVAIIIIGGWTHWPQIHYGSPVVRDPDSIHTIGAARTIAEEWKAGRPTWDPHTYFYPPFYINLLVVIASLSGTEFLEEKGRALTVLASLGAAIATFFIGCRMVGPLVGLTAAMFTTFGFIFIKQGLRPSPDSLQMLFVALALLPIAKRGCEGLKALFWSGLWMGCAIGAKYTAVFFLLPVFLSTAITIQREKKGLKVFRDAMVWSGSSLLGFFFSSPQFFFLMSSYLSIISLQNKIQHWGGLDFVHKDILTLLLSNKSNAVEFPFANSLVGMMGFFFVLILTVSVGWAMWKGSKKRDGFFFGLGLSCLLTYLYFSAGSKITEIRYLLPMVYMGALLVAVFIQDLVKIFEKWTIRWGLTTRAALLILTTFVLLPSLSRACHYWVLLQRIDSRVKSAEWIISSVRPGEKMLNFMFGPALPKNLYTSVQWIFPEYAYELVNGSGGAPSIQRLKEEQIDWVIWNSFYTKKFFADNVPPQINSYFSEWKRFYEDLQSLSTDRKFFPSDGGLGPDIEIFHIPSE